jgi:SAM-dependent methyltransferase
MTPKTVAKPWSNPSTGRVLLRELQALDWSRSQIADVGAGRGGFSKLLGDHLVERGIEPARVVHACDLIPESFEYEAIRCLPILPGGRLPFEDNSMDAAISMEVIEHVQDQFFFLSELIRITKPGGIVLVTTPNTHHLLSRLRTLTTGFPTLFDPLPLSTHDPRLLGGHIHPIAPYFLLYTGHRVGLTDLRLLPDRRKSSAFLWTLLLLPALLAGRAAHRMRLRIKHPAILKENSIWLQRVDSLDMLTSRTAILAARKPAEAAT